MTRDRVSIVVGFCARFYTPDSCDSLVREEYIIVVGRDISRSPEPPLHPQKPDHSPSPSWIELKYLSLESHRTSIIAGWRPDRRGNISTESFCDLDIHPLCSASHQVCIVENQYFGHRRIISIFVWIPKENRYSKATYIFCHPVRICPETKSRFLVPRNDKPGDS